MQFFKASDPWERKFWEATRPIFEQLELQKDLYYQGAYESAPLGDMIYDTNRAPLARAIPKEIFRDAFKQIFDAFVEAGSFESYLTVFRKIFGDNVVVAFEVPAPGKLNIDIEAEGVVLSDFVARYIEDNAYVFDEVIDDEGDNIAFQTIKGFQSQYELEQMLFEMVPGGIYTTISLTIGA